MTTSGDPGELASVAGELELFAEAVRWKAYVADTIRDHVRGAVLEVGAGIGGSTGSMPFESVTRWVCLEPDVGRCARIASRLERSEIPAVCEAVLGTVDDVGDEERFDTVLYLDVLEHIADDSGELERAADLLAPGGSLVVLAPAHPWLYTAFDESIGHHRRYTRPALLAVAPRGLELARLRYIDSAGLLASMANRFLLRSAMPTSRQIRFWDRTLVPVSRLTDALLLRRVGKSLVAIWKKA